MLAHHVMPILVAEDNRTTVRVVRNLLGQLGYTDVDDAPNGLEALVKMSERKYALVIADWNMEPMTGYELLQHVRADERFARIRFILMTADARPERMRDAKKARVDNYLLKPFNAQTLKAKIEASFLAGPTLA
jgi:two-component system chemotaxis response regulator CheY